MQSIQLNNLPYKTNQIDKSLPADKSFKGFIIEAEIKTDTGTIIPIKLESIHITKTEFSSYTSIKGPSNDETIGDILANISSARIIIKINYVTEISSILVLSLDLNVTEFNFDQGPKSISYSFISQTRISFPEPSGTVVIDKIASKSRVPGTDELYKFNINPLEFIKTEINSQIQIGGISGEIKRTSLNISIGNSSKLEIEVLKSV